MIRVSQDLDPIQIITTMIALHHNPPLMNRESSET